MTECSQSRFSVSASKKRLEPALFVDPAVRAGPDAELLGVVVDDRTAQPVFGCEFAEVFDAFFDGMERDQVAQFFENGEELQRASLVFGHVVAEKFVRAQARAQEMRVVQGRVLDVRVRQDAREMRLPDPLRQPHAARRLVEGIAAESLHPAYLRVRVAHRDGAEQRLVVAAAHDLDLPGRGQPGQALDKGGAVRAEPVPERSGIVERHVYGGEALEHLDKREVGLLVCALEDKIEIARRLVRVAAENQIDGFHIFFLAAAEFCGGLRAGVKRNCLFPAWR